MTAILLDIIQHIKTKQKKFKWILFCLKHRGLPPNFIVFTHLGLKKHLTQENVDHPLIMATDISQKFKQISLMLFLN